MSNLEVILLVSRTVRLLDVFLHHLEVLVFWVYVFQFAVQAVVMAVYGMFVHVLPGFENIHGDLNVSQRLRSHKHHFNRLVEKHLKCIVGYLPPTRPSYPSLTPLC